MWYNTHKEVPQGRAQTSVLFNERSFMTMPLQSTHHRYSFEVNNEDEFWAKISTAKNRAQQGEYVTLDEFNVL